jgi:predicted lipid-binding transport protein (Tim44 family)
MEPEQELHPMVGLALAAMFAALMGALIGGTFLPVLGMETEPAAWIGAFIALVSVLLFGFLYSVRMPDSTAFAPPADAVRPAQGSDDER